MPKKIEPTSEGAQVNVERKRLRRYLRQLRQDFDDMANARKWTLVKRVLIALVRIELSRIRQGE